MSPRGARAPPPPSPSRFFGNVCEGAIAIVVIEMTAAISGDEQVFKPIVVIISNSYSHSVTNPLQTRFFCHVLERAIRFLVVQRVPILRASLLRNCPGWRWGVDFSAVH